jgi:hypothetical protein
MGIKKDRCSFVLHLSFVLLNLLDFFWPYYLAFFINFNKVAVRDKEPFDKSWDICPD